MKFRFPILALFLISPITILAQNYKSYFTGIAEDTQTTPLGGACLMGGASENDQAMKWFLEQANGGDILVLRASGSDGYNDYLYSELGVSLNSVETIVFNDSTAAHEPYIHQKIQQAEAIWFAGGNQWKYVSYWRNTPIDSLINDAIVKRNIVIGGTSAGMAILGGFYFSAKYGTVTSSTALANPFSRHITVDSASFISTQYLSDVITDTHYDDRDRKGRHLVFLARILGDYGIEAKGIACDEYTAVCIDTIGTAKVYGNFPNKDDNAYFIQTNCELTNLIPENLSSGTPLDWNLENKATVVYAVKGTDNGSNSFSLKDWKTGTGGAWEHWYVSQGVFNQQPGSQPICHILSVDQMEDDKDKRVEVFPNPANDYVVIQFNSPESKPKSLKIFNELGQLQRQIKIIGIEDMRLSTVDMIPGTYLMEITYEDRLSIVKTVIIH